MKIAQIAPMIERVPPKKYGGTERVVHALTEELVRRGHKVTLFASGDSITSAKLVSIYPRGLREACLKNTYGLNIYSLLNVGLAYQRQKEFDIIHDHTGPLGLTLANVAATPVVLTLHGPLLTENRIIFQTFKKPPLVTISKNQAKRVPNINLIGTVYNGLQMEHFPFSAQPDDYLLFVGRISMEKGTHHAIEAACALNMPLIIAAKLEQYDLPYFREYVGPRLSETIRWIGEVDETERNKLMEKALCFLHPVTWPEPFGLTLIEAMACGCPVVAFNKGSIPEIIAHGKSGFVVSDTDEMIEAISRIKIIKREDCRRHSLENFNAKKMADGYEKIYRKILNRAQKLSGDIKTSRIFAQKTNPAILRKNRQKNTALE